MTQKRPRKKVARAGTSQALPTQLTFFLGKGGVGKTTVSAAYAIRTAARHPKKNYVLISTDPAHSLADVLELKITKELQKIPQLGNLHVWQVDAAGRFKEFLDQYRGPISDLIENGTFLSRGEIDSFLKSTLPGLAEMSALLTIDDLLNSGQYDEVIVDTAPIGHTLQLFSIPEQLARFLEFLELSGRRDAVLAAHFAGNINHPRPAVLDRWEQVLTGLRRALSQEGSRLLMVTSAEKFSLEESKRTAAQLEESSDMRVAEIVLNRVVQRAGSCPRCTVRLKQARSAQRFLTKSFPGTSVLVGEDPGAPVLGIKALGAFGAHVFDRKKLPAREFSTPVLSRKKLPKPQFVRAEWPRHATEMTFTLGKGGVGKTTVSTGLAFVLRASHPKKGVLICSTDPAPSLDDIFEQEIGPEPVAVLEDQRLTACELDATAEYRQWSERLKQQLASSLQAQQGGLHLELSFEHEMLNALLDIVPPGVDEIFAIFKIFDLLASGNQAIVIDMAPTGHALELLKTPERLVVWSRLLLKSLSAHRQLPIAQDLGVEVASISLRARELAQLLKDKARCRVFTVMLAEPLPDRETRRLLDDLQELGLRPEALFVNRILFEGDAGNCARCALAYRWQLATLTKLGLTWKGPRFAIRDFPHQIAGRRGLTQLTHELWRIK